MFQQAKNLYNLQKQAKQMKKMMKDIEIEAEEDGVLVVVNAAQDLVSVEISDDLMAAGDKNRLQKNIIAAMGRAQKKSQEVAAEKMKPLMGGMGLGGMTGGGA